MTTEEKDEMLAQEYAVYDAILAPLLGEHLELGKKYCSPIPRPRPDGSVHFETSASFSVFEGGIFTKADGEQVDNEGHLLWKDWGLARQAGSDAFALLRHLHPGLTMPEIGRKLATLERPVMGAEVKRQRKYKLELTPGPLGPQHLDWWGRYGVTEDTLNKYEVHGVDTLRSARGLMYSRTTNQNPAFAYLGGPGLQEWQFYQPSPKVFWRKGKFIYGWDQLPFTGKWLIFASGMKDGLVLHEATTLPFLATSGEGGWRQIQPKIAGLQKRFARMYTLFDPDGPGRLASETWTEKLGIPALPFRYVDHERDIADLARDYGLDFIRARMREAIIKTRQRI